MKRHILTYNGKTGSMISWCRALNISRSFFGKYIKQGLSIEQIIQKHDEAVGKIKTPVPGVDETLCWTCCRDGRTCPWMKNETPVAGWVADPTVKRYWSAGLRRTVKYNSFMIHACPLYKKEEEVWQEEETQSNE